MNGRVHVRMNNGDEFVGEHVGTADHVMYLATDEGLLRLRTQDVDRYGPEWSR